MLLWEEKSNKRQCKCANRPEAGAKVGRWRELRDRCKGANRPEAGAKVER